MVDSGESGGLGERRAIVVGRDMGVVVLPSVGQLDPDVVKASRFEPGTESENALAARRPQL